LESYNHWLKQVLKDKFVPYGGAHDD
jgi:hypothetical protein